MSNEPRLVINHKQLTTNIDHLLVLGYCGNVEKEHVSMILLDACYAKPFKVSGMELITTHPKLSVLNANVRKKLTELNVDFAEDH